MTEPELIFTPKQEERYIQCIRCSHRQFVFCAKGPDPEILWCKECIPYVMTGEGCPLPLNPDREEEKND